MKLNRNGMEMKQKLNGNEKKLNGNEKKWNGNEKKLNGRVFLKGQF